MTQPRPFFNATYWVGCNTESAQAIMFNLAQVYTQQADFYYIAAFDEAGKLIEEAKVEFYEENGEPYFIFNY